MTMSDLTARASSAFRLARKSRMFVAVPERDVFLVSYPRSGNTWLRSMIAQLLTRKKIDSLRELDYVVPDIYYEVPASRVVELPFYFVKSHEPLRLGTASAQYRRVIYIVRDPRDIVISYHRFLLNNGESHKDLSEFVSDFASGRIFPGSWQEHVESWTHESGCFGSLRIKILRYEDICKEPVGALEAIAEFIEVKIDKLFLEQIANESSIDEMRRKERSGNRPVNENGEAYFIGKGQPGAFETELDAEIVNKIVEMAGNTMRRYGYV